MLEKYMKYATAIQISQWTVLRLKNNPFAVLYFTIFLTETRNVNEFYLCMFVIAFVCVCVCVRVRARTRTCVCAAVCV